MFCKKCGTSINEGAGFCPNCGESVGNVNNAADAANGSGTGNQQNQVIPPVSSLWDKYPQNGQQANSQAGSGQAGSSQPGNGQAAGPQFTSPQYNGTQQDGFTKGITMDGGFKKFFGSHKVLLIVGAVVIVVLALVLCNIKVAANFLRKAFSSPEKYYQYVEKKTVEEFSSDFGELYGRYFLDRLNISDRSVSAQLSMTLGEGGQELMNLAGLAGVDMSWFESASFTLDSSVKKDTVFLGVGAVLNEVNILTGNVVLDLGEEMAYLQVPEVNKRYMGVEVDTGELGDVEELWEMYEALERICPDQKQAEQLFNRYLTTLIGCVDDVTKKNGVLEAEDIEQKCTVLTVTIDEETAKEMMIAVLTQMKEDKDIEKIIKNALTDEYIIDQLYLDDMSPEEAYENFQDAIDEELEYMEDYDDYSSEKIKMKVYVNNKGEIVGRTLTAEDTTIKMLMPEKGKKFGYECSYEDSYFDESIALTGTGTRSGDKVTGEFALEYNDSSMVNLTVKDYNTKDARKGIINGNMTLELSEDIEDLIGYTPGLSMIEDIKLTMDFKSDKSSSKCSMGVLMDDKSIVDIVMSYKEEKGYKGPNPGKDAVVMEDMDDLSDWGKDFDLGGFTEALKKADVPSEITESLEIFDGMDIETIMEMMYYYY